MALISMIVVAAVVFGLSIFGARLGLSLTLALAGHAVQSRQRSSILPASR